MRFLIILFSFTGLLLAQVASTDFAKFPLLGSAWVIAKGQNTRAYSSFGKSVPTHIIYIRFPNASAVKTYFENPTPASSPKVLVAWANLNATNYRSTSELLKDATAQLEIKNIDLPLSQLTDQINSPLKTVYLSIGLQTLSDTIYSMEQDFLNSDSRYNKFGISINGSDFYYNSRAEIDLSKPKLLRKYPVAWGLISESMRPGVYVMAEPDPVLKSGSATYSVAQTIVNDFNRKKYKSDFMFNSGWIDYAQAGVCYERIYCTTKKIAQVKYWQMHITPDIRWYPRDFLTGEPMIIDDLKMPFEKAMEQKALSTKSPNEVALKYYRKPYFSDSASSYASISFLDNVATGETPLNERDFINLRNIDNEATKPDTAKVMLYLDHIPAMMVRVKDEPNAIERAIVSIYSESYDDYYHQDSLYKACFNWKFNDKQIGKMRYPDSLQTAGKKLKRAALFDEQKYEYNGCPCVPLTDLAGYTTSQLRRFIYQLPPFCSFSEMCKTMYIYHRAFYYCTNIKDRAKIINNILILNAALLERERFIAKGKLSPEEVKKMNEACPPAWSNNFPNYAVAYGTSLRTSAAKLSVIVQGIRTNTNLKSRSIEDNMSTILSNWR